jgi:anti-sigma factor RsiW
MNTTALTLPDDEQFSAWLDGELGADEHNQVQAWLKDHPDDAARVRAWAADRDALRVRMDASLAEPLPQAWVDQLSRPSEAANEPRWWRRALVAGLMLASALGGAWVQRHNAVESGAPLLAMAGRSGPDAWVQRAATAHAVYAPEVRHPVEVSVQQGDAAQRQQQQQHLGQWLSKRLAMPVTLFNLQSEGFELVGGRLLPDASGPGAQLMYQRPDGERITVYVLRQQAPAKSAGEPDLKFEQVAGLDLMVWYEGGAACALVGKLPRAEMRKLADVMYAQVEDGVAGAPVRQ